MKSVFWPEMRINYCIDIPVLFLTSRTDMPPSAAETMESGQQH